MLGTLTTQPNSTVRRALFTILAQGAKRAAANIWNIGKGSDKALGQNSCQPLDYHRIFKCLRRGCGQNRRGLCRPAWPYSRYALRRPSRHHQFWLATHACFIMLGALKLAISLGVRFGAPFVERPERVVRLAAAT